MWATYLGVKWNVWILPCISCFQQCWSFSGFWMLVDFSFQHQHLPLLYWLNFLRRVWRCYWLKLALGELMISVIPLYKAIPRWLAQIYLVAILYGFLNFCIFCEYRSWWPSYETIFLRMFFIVYSLERHNVSLQSRGQVCLISKHYISL